MQRKQFGKMIKILCTHNGGEYINNDIQHLCDETRIHLKNTILYAPQQNGVAERNNRTLKEMASCMLNERSLPSKFWAKAINCASYI